MAWFQKLRAHATYANVTATLALFVALSGGSFALATLSGSEKKVVKKIAKKQADKRIKARAPGLTVQHAGSADTATPGGAAGGDLSGTYPSPAIANSTLSALRLRCPAGSRYFEGACLEESTRSAANHPTALLDCVDENARLPSADELRLFRHEQGAALASGGEWSSDRVPGGASATVVAELNETDDTTTGTHPYRCVGRALGG